MVLTIVKTVEELTRTDTVDRLAAVTSEWMHPYNDTAADTRQGILDALEGRPAPGGFIVTAVRQNRLAGILVMLRTGMSGYIPPNLLLFLAVDPSLRCNGIGTLLMKTALRNTNGPVKLHVEADNPAKRLYEKLGFSPAYLDMRYTDEGGGAT
jgi:[ribosomal protein S18]-alanine N-acetyltransferase